MDLDLSSASFRLTADFKIGDDLKIYPQVDGIVADAVNLPFSDQSIECVVCADVIEHISKPQRILNEISRVN